MFLNAILIITFDNNFVNNLLARLQICNFLTTILREILNLKNVL